MRQQPACMHAHAHAQMRGLEGPTCVEQLRGLVVIFCRVGAPPACAPCWQRPHADDAWLLLITLLAHKRAAQMVIARAESGSHERRRTKVSLAKPPRERMPARGCRLGWVGCESEDARASGPGSTPDFCRSA